MRQKALIDEIMDLSSFDAQILFVDSRTSSNSTSPNVGIIENQGDFVVLSFELNVNFPHNIPIFRTGSKLNLTSEDKSYSFVFE